MNIAAINGTWQAIAFLNFYMAEYGRDTKLKCDIILFEVNEELREICKEILNEFSFVGKIFESQEMPIGSYSNLWIGKLFSKNAKLIIHTYSRSPIILFEEGLHSYIEPKRFSLLHFLKGKETLRYKLGLLKDYFSGGKRLILDDSYKHLTFKKQEDKVIKKYFLLPLVKKNKHIVVNNEHLVFIINKIKDLQKQTIIIDRKKPIVLIVGQCFSNYGLLSFEEELAIYFQLVDSYLSKGYEVIWKGHPRAKLFDERIKESYNQITLLEESPLPLEVFTFTNDKIELSGISSSSLFYNKFLFDRKTTQIAHLIINNLNKQNILYSDFYSMFKFVDKNIDRIFLDNKNNG